MKKSRENKVKKLMGMGQSTGRTDDINCPYAGDCDRISRSRFLKVMGVGAAAIGAAAVGLGTVAKATEVPPPPPPVWYIRADRTTLGNWYNETPGDYYGDCAWILGAMCAPLGIENQVPHDGNYQYFDIFGGPLMEPDCGLSYKVYTCRPIQTSNCDPRFLEDPEKLYRRSTCWFTDGSQRDESGHSFMSITLNGASIPNNPGRYRLGLYFLDSDGNNSRTQDVTVTQGSNSVTQSISSFSDGVYLGFGVAGGQDIVIKITNTGPTNAVISGIFLDLCGTGWCTITEPVPQFTGFDVTTKGNWVDYQPDYRIPNYGSSWYLLCSWDYPNNVTSDSSVLGLVSGAGIWPWTGQCTIATPEICNIKETGKEKNFSFAWSWGNDASGRGLRVPPDHGCPEDCPNCPVLGGAASWASCYDDGGESSQGLGPDLYVDLVLPAAGGCRDTSCYQVSFYATDYDSNCRAQVIEIYDPVTGTLLADSSTASGGAIIGPGVYHTFFMPAGSYLVKVRRTGCTNAILSGIFVDCVDCPKGTGDMRTIGYWKHQFAVACGKNKGKAQVTPATLTAYLTAIGGKSALFSGLTMCGNNPLTSAYKILWPTEPATMCTRARQQLFALYLNWACGAVNWNEMVYDVVNGTYVQFGVLMPQLEAAITSNPPDCSWPHSTADWLNNSGFE